MKNTTPANTSVLEAMRARHSVRAFLDQPVSFDQVRTLLESARFAPSGVNTQPWRVEVLQGEMLQKVSDALLEARSKDEPARPDYQYYPSEWFDPYKSRRQACGLALYGALHIEKQDTARRLVQWNLNYRFFGAPVGLVIHLDQRLSTGSWLDVGMFIENIMLAAIGLGLGTCPQAAIAEYPDILRDLLQLPSTQSIVCGIAIGYPDPHHPVNQYRTERLAVDEFTRWHA